MHSSLQSNIAELREKLLEEARKKAEEIIAKAREEAKRIVEEAERKWREKAKREKEKIINNARLKAQIIVSEARRRARILLVDAKNKAIEGLYNEVLERLKRREGFDHKLSIKNLLREALEYIPTPSRIRVNPSDRDALLEVLREIGLTNVKVVEDTSIIGGVIVESAEGEVVDNSYNARFNRAKTVLTPMITKKLWG